MSVVEGSPHRFAICPAEGVGSLRPLLHALAREGVQRCPPFSRARLVPRTSSRKGRSEGLPAESQGGEGPRERQGPPGQGGIDLALLLWPPSLGPGALRFMVDELRSLSGPLGARHGALVLVYPGDVFSPRERAWTPGIVEALGRSLVRSFAREYAPEARINFVVGGRPRRRGGRPRSPSGENPATGDLVRAALFLGGEGARFITGETLPVDGGAHLFWTAGGEG